MLSREFIENAQKYFISTEVKTIYDVGAGDCEESLELRSAYPNADVFAFEANPECINDCRKKIAGIDRVSLIPICVNNYTGFTKFYPVNGSRPEDFDDNIRASSLFRFNGTKYLLRPFMQDEIRIPCMTLKEMSARFGIPHPDIVWMDLQGAELNALEGMGELLENVKFIHTEAYDKEAYVGQSMYPAIKGYLEERYFVCLTPEPQIKDWTFADFDFGRKL